MILKMIYNDLNPCEVENDNNQERNHYKHLQYGTECDYYTNFQFVNQLKVQGLSIIRFNSRSLRANFDIIKKFWIPIEIPF